MGWGCQRSCYADVVTLKMRGGGWGCQCLCYADGVTLKMGGLVWGGDVNVLMLRRCCYIEDVGGGWGCQSSCYADVVTLKMWGVGGDVKVHVTQTMIR